MLKNVASEVPTRAIILDVQPQHEAEPGGVESKSSVFFVCYFSRKGIFIENIFRKKIFRFV